VLNKKRAKAINVLMRYFNAKVGTDNTGFEDVMGKQGMGQRNENRERFLEPC
jgi:hypothetical protein